MKLLYTEEHTGCHLYRDGEDAEIKYETIFEGDLATLDLSGITIAFVMQGSFHFSGGHIVNQYMSKGKMMLLPSQYKMIIKAETDTSLFLMKINSRINFCEQYPIELLFKTKEDSKALDSFHLLKTNKRISAFFNLLLATYQDGLKCQYFFDVKQKELLYYLRAYYSKDDLYKFFAPVISRDLSFSELIYEHADKIKTLEDMAALTHYSVSGVKKRFKQVFDIPPSHWIKKEKAKKVYHEINCSNKSFKQIALDFEFSSPSHLDNFCKAHFAASPGELRKKNKENI
jgi:AraC-like DNA-binding protein